MAHELIEHNPMYKRPALIVLTLMQKQPEATRAQIEEQATAQWQDSFFQSPTVTLDVLIRNGIVTEQVLIDGEPYSGSLEDAMMDADIAEDAQAEARIAMTEQGEAILVDYTPEVTLAQLIEERPHYEDVFRAVLAACICDGGASRGEVEAVINEKPQLKPDPTTKQTKVYPQYFIDALETAGGIQWDGAWHTTEAGKGVLAT